MKKYPKIQTVFKRDGGGKIIEGDWTRPEFEYLKDNKWVFTEKVDGTNIRVMWNGVSVRFGGKTDNAQIPVFLLYKLQELFEGTVKKQIFRDVFQRDGIPFDNVCLYGEGYGAKIQKGGGNYISDGVDFVLIDVRVDRWWLLRDSIEDIAKKFSIKTVPVVGVGTLAYMVATVMNGFDSQWGNFNAEGIVATPDVQLFNRKGERIITKIKNKDFKRLECCE